MLKKLFSKKDKTPSKGKGTPSGSRRSSLTPALREVILKKLGNTAIPSMPKNAQRAFELSADPTAQATDFVEIIEADDALSSRIIRVANSVVFGRKEPAESIEQAVINIGNEELRNFIGATSLSDLFPSRHPARQQFWQNDLATAIISKELAKRFVVGKEGIAFLGGLLHDIGKLLMLQRTGAPYDNVLFQVRSKGASFEDAEVETFNFHHGEVGQMVAQHWRFSEDLVSIIAHHHCLHSENGGPDRSLANIIGVADVYAHSLGIGHLAGNHRLKESKRALLPLCDSLLGISEKEREELLLHLSESVPAELVQYQSL